MTDLILPLLAANALPILFLGTFLSCLALPVPSSLLMLTAGAFTASGDLGLAAAAAAAFGGAVLGDQAGFALGRRGEALIVRLSRAPQRARLLAEARGFASKRGGTGVFLSRWLFSPLGPYVNLAAGATGMGWALFTLWGAAGEAVWVALYVGLGRAFGDRIDTLAGLAGNLSGALAAGAVTLGLGLWLMRAARRRGRASLD